MPTKTAIKPIKAPISLQEEVERVKRRLGEVPKVEEYAPIVAPPSLGLVGRTASLSEFARAPSLESVSASRTGSSGRVANGISGEASLTTGGEGGGGRGGWDSVGSGGEYRRAPAKKYTKKDDEQGWADRMEDVWEERFANLAVAGSAGDDDGVGAGHGRWRHGESPREEVRALHDEMETMRAQLAHFANSMSLAQRERFERSEHGIPRRTINAFTSSAGVKGSAAVGSQACVVM